MRRSFTCTVRSSATDELSVRWIATVVVLLACSSLSVAQSTIEYWSDTPPDARSLSLGEAFVAVAQGPSALFYNVAGMAAQKGLAVSFDTRTEPIYPTQVGVNHIGLSGTLGTIGKGIIGLRYSSYSEDNGPVSLHDTAGNVTGFHELGNTISDLMFAYSIHLTPTLDFGLGGGVVFQSTDFALKSTSYLMQWGQRSQSAAYINLGIRYHESILKSNIPDEFSFAASLNHVGFNTLGNYGTTTYYLARSFRGGLAWKIAQPETTAFANQFFSGMLSGQFKKVFNEGDFSTDQIKSNKGYWSMGMEIGIWDMLFLRYGLYYRPYDSQYSYANNAQSNLGGGVRIPIHKIIRMKSPLWLSIDYAMMHLLDGSYEHALSLAMHLDHDFFPAPPEPVDQ